MNKNITLAVDDKILKSAKIYAAEQGTSVSSLVAKYLETLSKPKLSAQEWREKAEKLLADTQAEGGFKGPILKREEVYDERMLP